jgi:hypothetical protein
MIQEHLSKQKQIELGSFYTPNYLVDRMYSIIDIYLDKKKVNKKSVLFFDNASGYGAFYKSDRNFLLADIDKKAIDKIKQDFKIEDDKKLFSNNSLEEVSRSKYNIDKNIFLINIGNPPYNDTASIINSGKKGTFSCDFDLLDRDLGISFLKSFNKLNSNIVCVLHPLSYLIKEANFKRLKEFKDNYKLVYGEIFSSEHFSGTGKTKFPIVIAFYERNSLGMDFSYIKNFNFNILNSKKKFKLLNFKTTDGFIYKYPKELFNRNNFSGFYYYTFRDINSLKRNSDFSLESNYNSISVSIDELYKYAYLYSFKKLFSPKDLWLYGNLSPLLDEEIEKFKKEYVLFSVLDSGLHKNISADLRKRIKSYYSLDKDYRISDLPTLRKIIQERIS